MKNLLLHFGSSFVAIPVSGPKPILIMGCIPTLNHVNIVPVWALTPCEVCGSPVLKEEGEGWGRDSSGSRCVGKNCNSNDWVTELVCSIQLWKPWAMAGNSLNNNSSSESIVALGVLSFCNVLEKNWRHWFHLLLFSASSKCCICLSTDLLCIPIKTACPTYCHSVTPNLQLTFFFSLIEFNAIIIQLLFWCWGE